MTSGPAIVLLILALAPLTAPARAWVRRIGPAGRWPAMVAGHWLRFALPAIVLLAVTGQAAAFWRMPAAFTPAAAALGVDSLAPRDRWTLIAAAAVGVGLGILGGMVLTAWRAWRGRPEGTLFGDASSVRPGQGELGWAAAVAVTAGLTEEAYFRLLLPLLATQAFGNAPFAFAGAAVLFGFAHLYQGWRGVAATTAAGAALTVGYLATDSLCAVMLVHAAGDLGHLVLRPAVRQRVEARRSRKAGVRR